MPRHTLSRWSRSAFRLAAPVLGMALASAPASLLAKKGGGKPAPAPTMTFEPEQVAQPDAKKKAVEGPPPATTVPAPAGRVGRIPGSADFPQFQGPARDGVLSGPHLGTNWEAGQVD